MTDYQAEVVVGKLREAESLLISLTTEEPKNEALHDARILVWNAIDKMGKANV
jgi:Flp pilus assembly protein TadD